MLMALRLSGAIRNDVLLCSMGPTSSCSSKNVDGGTIGMIKNWKQSLSGYSIATVKGRKGPDLGRFF
jgi:hypothetical protein